MFLLQQKCQSFSSIFGTTEWPRDHFDFIFNNNLHDDSIFWHR